MDIQVQIQAMVRLKEVLKKMDFYGKKSINAAKTTNNFFHNREKKMNSVKKKAFTTTTYRYNSVDK